MQILLADGDATDRFPDYLAHTIVRTADARPGRSPLSRRVFVAACDIFPIAHLRRRSILTSCLLRDIDAVNLSFCIPLCRSTVDDGWQNQAMHPSREFGRFGNGESLVATG